jgi:diguanylate cyclase (GGDEF)-like protein
MTRVPTMALLTVRLDGWYQNQAWHGAAMAARLLGVRLVALVGCAYGDPEERGGTAEIYRLANSGRIDAYLPLVGALGNFQGNAPVEELLRLLPPRPTVCIGVSLPGHAAVVPEGDGMGELVRHLVLVHGLTRIAYIGGPQRNLDAIVRRQAFLAALEECGALPQWTRMTEADFTPGSAREAMARILDAGPPPQAVVCANDAMAIGARSEILHRGLRIPDDIVLTGYDDIEEARTMVPSLTSVNASVYHQAFRAVESALELLEGAPPLVESIPTKLVLRRSCGCRAGSSNFVLPRLMVEATNAPQPGHLREILSDPTGSEAFLAGLEATFDQAEHAEIDHWEQVLLAAAHPPPSAEVSQVIMEAHSVISQARHGLDLRRRQSLQHLMRDEYLAMQMLLADLSLDTLPFRLLETLSRFSEARLRILLFHKTLAPLQSPDYASHPFELEIDTWSRRVGEPDPDSLLPLEDDEPGRWVTLSISMSGEHYGIIQFREWISNELILESFRLSLWMIFSSAQKDHREKLAMAELRRLSSRDELTGLLNRRGILEQGEVLVQSARRSASRIGVVLCDLDGLKAINDAHGHSEGDLAIRCLARALEDGFRQSDVVGRLGGDEFVVVTVLGPEGGLEGAIDRVRAALAQRSSETGRSWRARTSAGWMAWDPSDGSTLEQAMKRADDFLYHDKRDRKSRADETSTSLEIWKSPSDANEDSAPPPEPRA